MHMEKKVPEWRAAGVEPPDSLKAGGFQAGYKPPASYFNWFWSGVCACLKEIQAKLPGHADNRENPHGVTATQIGLGNVDNTKDNEKRVKYAGEAGKSEKVNHSFVVRMNGGRAEGTDLFTFDGSAGKSLDITPDAIAAAKKDLSNVNAEAFKNAVADSGAGGIPIVAAESIDGASYTAAVPGVTELNNGMLLTIIPQIDSASTAVTLDVNGMGARRVMVALSTNSAALTAPKQSYFNMGRPITLQYDANGSTTGAWKTFSKQQTSAQDLYGQVPIESGGTGGATAEAARQALQITLANLVDVTVCDTAPTNLTEGQWYLVRSEE